MLKRWFESVWFSYDEHHERALGRRALGMMGRFLEKECNSGYYSVCALSMNETAPKKT